MAVNPTKRRGNVPRPRRARKAAGQAVRRKPAIMTVQPYASDALITETAQALGMTIDPAWHGAIKFNLQLILLHAARVAEFKLPDDTEPAPVFRA
jgi:hypothetical protein